MTDDVDPIRNDDGPPQPYSPPAPYLSDHPATWADAFGDDSHGQPPTYTYPTGTPPGPYLSDGDATRADRVAGPRSADRDPLLVRWWRRLTGAR
jgi:hypothetical protein